MNIYVGNLSFDITQDELEQAFAAHGEVASASVIEDKYTGRSRGFGFVEMPKSDEARVAIEQMNGVDTSGVTPMAHPLDMAQRLREDVVSEENQREHLQAHAPAVENGLFLVPKVIE